MKLLYGTHNPSKLNAMMKALAGMPIEIYGFKDCEIKIKEAEESGNDPLSNAVRKSRTYYEQLKIPVFSCDSGLYFEEVSAEDQPGVAIRRVNGERLDDDGMLSYYQNLAKKYGGKLTAYYKNSICLIIDSDTIMKYDGEDIHSEKFYIVDKAHDKRVHGFPLDSLSVEIDSGLYYFDIEEQKQKSNKLNDGFRNFFIRAMNLE